MTPRSAALLLALALVAAACGARSELAVSAGTSGAGTSGAGSGGGSGGAACSSQTFGPQTTFAVGPMPYSVAVGDFDGDGRLDLVVANFDDDTGSTVSVLRGTGAGSFEAQATFSVGMGPWSVTVGDFDHDGHLDVATANLGEGTISVLLGTGEGGFGLESAFPAGPGPASMAVGDFDEDGALDLVVGDLMGTVRVLLGTGAGSFGPPAAFASGALSWSVAVGDFDEDGHLDLAVGGSNDAPSTVSVLLGTGKGTFGPPTMFAVGGGPTTVAVGDFDGDGHLDLVAANDAGGSVSILLGTGTGSFGAQMVVGAGPGPSAVAVADFDGDGHPDLAVTDLGGGGADTVTVLLGTGTGSFVHQTAFAVGAAPYAVAVGDFDGDGHPDLAVANSLEDEMPATQLGTVSILLDVCGGAGG
jgi:hypothetical protein